MPSVMQPSDVVVPRPRTRRVLAGVASMPELAVTLGIMAVSLLASRVLLHQQVPIYRASTLVAVFPHPSLGDPQDVLRSVDTLERRTIIATFARMIGTNEIRQRATATAGIGESERRGYRLSASVPPSTNLLRIDVEGPQPGEAASIANAAAEVLAVDATALYRIYALKPIAAAVPPSRPAFPDAARYYLVAAVIGVIVAGTALLAIRRFPRGTSTT